MRLITRGDDGGSSHSANLALKECAESGFLKNISLMAPCKHINEAAELLSARKDVCFGLHATINAEWNQLKWKPICKEKDVSSIINADGFFFNTTNKLKKNIIDSKQLINEMDAQLDRLHKIGFNIEYVDTHMGFENISEELVQEFNSFCIKKGLVNYRLFNKRFPKIDFNCDSYLSFTKHVKSLVDGQYLVILHPAYYNDEMIYHYYEGVTWEEIAKSRDYQRRLCINNKMLQFCKENNVITVKYTDCLL